MSSIIKLNAKSKMLNVSLRNNLEKSGFETERDENYFQRQLQQQYERGYNDGQKSAIEKLEREYSEKLAQKYESLNKVVLELDASVVLYDEAFEKIVINLAIEISEKIVKREILRESIISKVLKESIKRVIGTNKIFVKLNPADLEKIVSESKNLFADDSFSKIKFESDERIERGGCFVETEIGNVDARISSQFNEMRKQLEANLSSNGS